MLISASVFFLVVKLVNKLVELRKPRTEEGDVTKTCPECFSKIPHKARRCAFCTSELSADVA